MWDELHLLPDGTGIRVRAMNAGDQSALLAAHRALSEESQRLRFLAPKPTLSRAEARYLTDVDGVDHVALAAFLDDEPRVITGVARFVRLPEDPHAAEMAIVVGDRFQRRGLGTLLARELAAEARAHGITRFKATVLAENEAVTKLIAVIAERLDQVPAGPGVRELSAELAA
ncbi:MAG: GNAT family N-acetyltransferase [Solirubrobacteraceae bacterium]|nr:MAG: hypothetical protein DLM63_10995 [Solirubrobacterales bacterium]